MTPIQFSNKDPHRLNVTEINLNAGASKRVVDFIEKNYPATQVKYEAIGDHALITAYNLKQDEKEKLLIEIKNIYPIEVIESYKEQPKEN